MKIIVDECISESTIQLLKNVGFDILRINDILYYGVDDERIFDYTSKNQIPLLTHDKRFGFIYYETLETPSTIIILEVRSPHPKATNNLLEKFFEQIDLMNEDYKGKLIIISVRKIRIRSKLNRRHNI